MKNEIILSVIVPVYNEELYIRQNIESLLTNRSKNFEVVYIDNNSTDNTANIIESFSDPRIKLTKQNKTVSPRQNHIDGIELAQGDHVFLVGGDDYFVEGILDRVLRILKKDIILFCPLEIFNEGELHGTKRYQNTSDVIDRVVGCHDFLPNFLTFSNHDTLMHSFIPKEFLKNINRYNEVCLETFWVWMAIHTLAKSKRNINRDHFQDTVFFMRQYASPLGTRGSDYNADAKKSVLSKMLFTRSLGSIYNTFQYFFECWDFSQLMILLFSFRGYEVSKNKLSGFYGFGNFSTKYWKFGPVPTLILSPVLDMIKIGFLLRKYIIIKK